MSEHKAGFLDILVVLSKGKKFIFFFTLIMSVIAVLYVLLATELWTSDFTILPLSKTGALNMSNNLLEGLGMKSPDTPASLAIKYSAVLKNRHITANTIRKYDLINYFEITEEDTLKAMDMAIEAFHSSIMKVLVDEETDFVTVRIRTDDKHLSKAMAEHYLDILTDYVLNVATNVGRQKRELLEGRVDQITGDLINVSDSLQAFQNTTNIVHIEHQARVTVELYQKLLEDLYDLELDLTFAEKYVPNSLQHLNLQDRKAVLLETLAKIEENTHETPYLLPLHNITDQLFLIQELVYSADVYRMVLATVYPQLELARIEEVDYTDRFEVIEYPVLAGLRSYPKRALICVVVFLLSFLFSSSCVLVAGLTSDEDKAKIKTIWKNIKG